MNQLENKINSDGHTISLAAGYIVTIATIYTNEEIDLASIMALGLLTSQNMAPARPCCCIKYAFEAIEPIGPLDADVDGGTSGFSTEIHWSPFTT